MTIKDLMTRRKNNDQECRVVSPAVNIQERESAIVLYAEMPGINKEQLSVEVHGDELTVSAKRFDSVPKDYAVYVQERIPVEYRRVFSLSNHIDKENIEAKYEDGILIVTLHKSEQAQPKKIMVM